MASSKIRCERCKTEEYIPFTQYVKFNDKVCYLCKSCWDLFGVWFNAPRAMKKP